MVTKSIFGESLRMQQVIAQIDEAAESRRGVLITGERGTGRGLVARAIHDRSSTPGAPFVAVACAHFAPNELEQALLGCETPILRKANGRPGQETIMPGSLVHEAMGGTLYFTHLCEIPDRVQVRLARLFRDGEAVVGSRGKPVPLNIRPVAAASQSHQAALVDGRLRQDLHRRFSACQIDLPPLRERRDDVPALVNHYVEETCRTAAIPVKSVADSAIAVLSALPWRGNLTELRTTIDVLVLHARGATIELDDVLEQVRLEGAQQPVPVGLKGTLREARVHFERDYISAVLEHHHGKIPEAAQVLGIQRTNLYRKLRTLRLLKPSHAQRARARA
jgi:two-component system nitrogen regulation response regulator NtrX